MQQANDLFAYGTFDMMEETLFVQTWIISARISSGASIPCAFFLLPDKKGQTYKLVLNAVKEKGVTNPNNFHLDYEAGAIKAVRDIYP